MSEIPDWFEIAFWIAIVMGVITGLFAKKKKQL